MRRHWLGVLAGIAGLGAGGQALQAGVVAIPNGDFMNPTVPGSPYASPAVVSWQKDAVPQWWTDAGYPADNWTNSAGVFANVNFPGQFIDNLSSTQGAFFFAVPGYELFQDNVGHTFEVGKSYHMEFGVIGGGYGMVDGTPLKVALYFLDAGNKVEVRSLTVLDSAAVNDRTHMADFAFDVPAVQAGDAWAGQPIGVQICSDYTSGGGYWDVGNLQLTELPEPGSLALLGCGLAGLLGLRRRA